ncbi:uncharacterized protein DEA37_0013706 [Paragonimus westermani]|uniref:Major facilitator superfamily (MFS) profile domain-containing protein n=1 Tax=Paragonimus westermani TaxID=34504 RepID=A0A5J4NWZ5_9TREM|nr:uncharacterized protein DEA37_0013706 [Paragonimus westermani]
MSKDEAVSQLTFGVCSKAYNKFHQLRDRFYSWRHLAWIILLISALNVICIGGKRRAFGIFIAALHTAYNETSMTELNWIGDSYASLGFFLMPFATTAIITLNRPYRMTMFLAGLIIFVSCMTSAAVPDPGYLFLTHTILHGIGSTLILCGTSLVTGDYFDKTHRYHVLATAFVSGGPYGVLIFGPLFSYWIHDYSWQQAFVYSGILFLLTTWLGAITFLPRYMFDYMEAVDGNGSENEMAVKKPETKPDNSRPTPILLRNLPKASDGRGWAFCSVEHIRHNPQIVLWSFERLLQNVVVYGLLMNLTSYVSEALNNEIIRGAKVNLYFGIGESFVFTVGALIGDRIRGHLPLVYLIGAAFAALFLFIVQRSYTDINVIYLLAGFTGAAVGVGNTFLYATAEEVMLVHGSIAFPMTKMVAGVGMLIAPVFSGGVIDKFGYRGFFISMAVLVLLRVILLAVICFVLRYKQKIAMKNEAENEKLNPKEDIVHCCQYTSTDCGLSKPEKQALNSIRTTDMTDTEQRAGASGAWYKIDQQKVP